LLLHCIRHLGRLASLLLSLPASKAPMLGTAQPMPLDRKAPSIGK
jgi:hypothetical protein